jgi:FkbM family methyltransferase
MPEYEHAQRKWGSIPADDTFKYFGLTNLDKYLYHNYLKNIKKGFYIECGAVNGVEQSNTAALNFYYDWTGLLIEANPFQYQNILKHRSCCHTANCALVSHEYKEEYIEGFFSANPRCLQGPMTDSEVKGLEQDADALKELEDCMCAQIKTNNNYDKKRYPDSTKTLEVPARTLDWVLASNNIEKADFFSLDVEGYELEVLKGWSPDKYPIKYVLIEGRLIPEEKSPINEYMEQNNYQFEEHVGVNNMLYSCSEKK